ncbi:MAG TPA: hypothetical protein VM142_08680 [Acidimicrobiales bacterium]|nr:hypothetical protein [Acidimicrobiales bacterium]
MSAGGAAGQVPPITTPPDSTAPTTPPPPKDEPPPVPSPSEPPPTVAPGGPGTPAPPGTPVTTAPPAPAGPTTATTNPGAGAPAPPKPIQKGSQVELSLDLSGIDALRRQARGKGPRAAEPDFGFDSSLPFQDGVGEGASAPTEEALELGADEEKIAQVRAAGSVAAGLIALLLVGLATWVLRQARSAARPSPH